MIHKPNGELVFPNSLDVSPAYKTPAPILVGVGVVLAQNRRLLVSRRKAACKIGVNAWSLPGGSIELNESIYNTIIRECREETGLEVEPVKFENDSYVWFAQEWFREQHTWTMYTQAVVWGGRQANPEPHKHTDWEWASLAHLESICSDQDWLPIAALKHNASRLGL